MYSEETFKNYIFWLQVKRVVLIILFSIIGAGLGIGIGMLLKGTLQVSSYNNAIIIVLTILFFLLSLLITAGTGKEVQDGYWKIAVLRKLTAIQKTMEETNELIEKGETHKLEKLKKMNTDILEELGDVKKDKKPKAKTRNLKKPELN